MKLTQEHIQFVKMVIERYCIISPASLSQLCSIADIEQYTKNETILSVGTTAKSFKILQKGAVIAFFLDSNGDTYIKNIFLEGHFVGSTVSYLTESPSQFELQAIEDSTLISVPFAGFRELIGNLDDLKNFYIAYLEKNWVIDKEKREVAIVMQDAKTRYQALLEEHPGIDQRVSLQYIASHLGITPTQLSRIRKKI